MRYVVFFLVLLTAALPAQADMYSDASNATLPDARTNLGLGTTDAAHFGTLTLGGAISPSLIDNPGSRASWPPGGQAGQRWQLAIGSVGSPILTGGPAFSISEYFKVPTSECGGASYNTACASGLTIDVSGDVDNKMVTSGMTIYANNLATDPAAGVQALNVVANGFGSSVGAVQGAYIQGLRNNTTVAAVMGAEISSANYTASNCAVSYTNIGVCDGIWLSSRGNSGTHLSSALHIGNGESYSTLWEEGITLNNISASGTSIMDKSSSTTSLSIQGTHTTAIHTDAAAGAIDLNGNTTVTTGLVTVSNNLGINLNALTAAQPALLRFQDATTTKWSIGKQTDNSLGIFDNANSTFPFAVSVAGDTTVGETGKTVNLIGAIQTSGTPGIASCTAVAAGATVTIKNGLITAFTGC
jgi:hypothetical protein